jgi:hypothetical protein
MGLPWIRLDTNTFDHPKLLYLAEDKHHRAIVLHLSGMTYTAKHGLDGFIPRAALRVIGGQISDVNRLILVGLWQEIEGGWTVNGWDEYQVSDAEAQARKEKARRAAHERWKKGGDDGT